MFENLVPVFIEVICFPCHGSILLSTNKLMLYLFVGSSFFWARSLVFLQLQLALSHSLHLKSVPFLFSYFFALLVSSSV